MKKPKRRISEDENTVLQEIKLLSPVKTNSLKSFGREKNKELARRLESKGLVRLEVADNRCVIAHCLTDHNIEYVVAKTERTSLSLSNGILIELIKSGCNTPAEIADRMGLGVSTTLTRIRRLEAREILRPETRERVSPNRRQYTLGPNQNYTVRGVADKDRGHLVSQAAMQGFCPRAQHLLLFGLR